MTAFRLAYQQHVFGQHKSGVYSSTVDGIYFTAGMMYDTRRILAHSQATWGFRAIDNDEIVGIMGDDMRRDDVRL